MLRLAVVALLALSALAMAPAPAHAAACDYSYERFYDAGVYVGCQVPYGGPECKAWALIYWDPLPEADCDGTHVPPAMPTLCTFAQTTDGLSAECATNGYETTLGCRVSFATWTPTAPTAAC